MKSVVLKLYLPVVIVAILSMLAVWSLRQAERINPLDGHDQIVLVASRTDTASNAKLYMFTRDGDGWRIHTSGDVVIGRNGMAWGRGLHDTRSNGNESVKVEGDGKSPMGVFGLSHVYGYQAPGLVNILFPYTKITPDMICIDDIRSEYYAMIVKSDTTDIDMTISHEKMLRDDYLYRWLVMVDHNTTDIRLGAGSCIFLHLWAGEDSYTAGCTAMSDYTMQQLLSWLDPRKSPVLVQLTRKNYLRLKEEWGLPDITI